MRTLSHAWRQLRCSPLFALAAAGSLALGIGANIAIFTLANALFLRPLQVFAPARLVRITSLGPEGDAGPVIAATVDEIRRAHLFSGVCGFLSPQFTVDIEGRLKPMAMHAVSGDCFETLGVRPILGRVLTRDDDRPEAPGVVVLSFEMWQREFGGSPSALGRMLRIESNSFTIVGVAEPRFDGLMVGFPPRLFYPISHTNLGTASPAIPTIRTELFARLPDGITAAAAAARLESLWPAILEASASALPNPAQRYGYLVRRPRVSPASPGVDYSLRPRFERPLQVLLAISMVVLLVTCVNVANLLLARASARRRDVLIRSALGASPMQLLAEAAAESVWLIGAGALGAFAIARLVDAALVSQFTSMSPNFRIELAPDVRIVAFAVATALMAFVLCALAPALQAARVDASALNAVSARVTSDSTRLTRTAMVAQIALTMVLLTVGWWCVNALRGLQHAPSGFPMERTILASLTPVGNGYSGRFVAAPYYRSLLERLAATGGIESAALSHSALLTSNYDAEPVSTDGAHTSADQHIVTPTFFEAMQIPILTGTTFLPSAASAEPLTAVVSETLARTLFGSPSDAIGRLVRVGPTPEPRTVQIVGVARDAVLTSPQRHNTAIVYLNFFQMPDQFQTFPYLVVRSYGGTEMTSAAIRLTVERGGREFVPRTRTLREQRQIALAQEQLLAGVSSAYAVLGLTLAAVGVYGLFSFLVAERTREVGVRMALGATRGQVIGLFVREAAVLAGFGLLIGLPAAFAATRAAAALLRGGGAGTSLLMATVLVAGVAMAAASIPARRAASFDPIRALRQE